MSSDFAIKVENLSKCYQIYDKPRDRLLQGIMPRLQRLAGKEPKQYCKEFWALKDVSFEVKRGETVGIIGKNGSGKSTLLQMICGTLTPTSGSIQTNGRVAALLELGAGFNPEFTGRENVYMNASILGLTKEEIDARFDDIAAFADIGNFIEQPVKSYSSGMYVRLAFAVIAHTNADILVVDEALAVGDAFFTQKCMRFMRKFKETGTILLVSHDSGAIINMCDYALWLDTGTKQRSGTAKDVCESYLASFYDNQEPIYSPSGITSKDTSHSLETNSLADLAPEIIEIKDQRIDFINASNLRNDIEVFSFNEQTASFGIQGALINNVSLMDLFGNRLSWVVGGELVKLTIKIRCINEVFRPIVGFFIKDRLGQVLFGDNTFISQIDTPLHLKPSQFFTASFDFKMPILPIGDYSVCAAIAEGTQHDHIQHHWAHDALLLKSHSTSITTGLIGIPMHHISMKADPI